VELNIASVRLSVSPSTLGRRSGAQASLATRAAEASIRAYKQYVSPYLDTHCHFHPTCSAYTYEAIADYGVLKGVAMGALRIARCNADSGGGDDPVPHAHQHAPALGASHLGAANAQPAVLSAQPLAPLASPGRAVLVDPSPSKLALASAARALVGTTAATLAGLVGGVVGGCVGALMGAAAGSHRLDALNGRLAASLGSEAVIGAAIIEHTVAMPGHRALVAAERMLPAPLASVVGGVAGAVSGLVLGGLGGACQAATGSARMLGLLAYHLVLHKTGAEIPAPQVASALARPNVSPTPTQVSTRE
jgi:uncharacterized protein